MAENLGLNLRRLRKTRWIRELVREVRVHLEQLIQPLFICEGLAKEEPVFGLPGVYRETPDSIFFRIEADIKKGIRKFLLFGVPASKQSMSFDGAFTSEQILRIKKKFGEDLFLAVDTCLCSYTEHGHCGVLTPEKKTIDSKKSIQELSHLALSYGQAGADCIAPSDMMDGRVGLIRKTLDQVGLHETLIMSYSSKFHSKFYGPFRIAAQCSPQGSFLKDRATYQIDPGSPGDAYRSALRDVEEGADILMVKPGLPYLDILKELSSSIRKPWAVYEVSGEFAAIACLHEKGLIDASGAHLEVWTSFLRAGASMIITYGARSAKEYLEKAL